VRAGNALVYAALIASSGPLLRDFAAVPARRKRALAVIRSAAMETIKSFEQFFDPDPRSSGLAPRLEGQYEIVLEYCQVHDGVPEDVRSYFNMVVTLYLYGWLYYPFYTLADFLSRVVVEMALRERLPPKRLDKRGRDPRTLRHLLREAKDAGLLHDEGFPHLQRARGHEDQMAWDLAEILGLDPEARPERPYADVLIETVPDLRNIFAHPRMHAVLTPGQALDGPILAAEIINQLWPKSASE
jgi:hypothetical protein